QQLLRMRDPLAGLSVPISHGTAEDAYALLNPGRTAVITGAGISTDSGIPDYRSPGSPERSPMTGEAFRASERNRQLYWARAYIGWLRYREFQPNSTHRDLAALRPASIITQNVDGLHAKAGSDSVIELHGSLHRVECLQCGRTWSRDWMQATLDELNPGFLESAEDAPIDAEINPDGDVEFTNVEGFQFPNCPQCFGILKPEVVYFGEAVKSATAEAATHAVDAAESLVVLGSSLAVHSALRLVRRASNAGKPIVIVTDGPTRADDLATVRLVSRVAPFTSGWRAAASTRVWQL
ncbi:Sir2 family NAD-dependent protein deacetylase, partial [Ancrocorticia sp.]|uniref:Sir2 family NAD-dependent protein deacetylase n=1 Tax=Ancrocorticia sp. TaxID=2593684 RepID=UPI003F921F39